MIRFRMFGTECRIHALAVVFAALGCALGMGRELPHMLAAVFIHETAHIAAAAVCGIRVEHIDIMPFGGAARISDIYSAGKAALAVTAAAGPAANLLTATAAAALAWWDILSMGQAAVMVRANMLLMLFNLLPALPLDGGRIFYAMISLKLTERTALRLCAALSYALAGALMALLGLCWLRHGVFNITFAVVSVFLVSSTIMETGRGAHDPASALAAITEPVMLPAKVQLVAFPEDADAVGAVRFMRRGATIFALISGDRVRELVTGEEMARRALGG